MNLSPRKPFFALTLSFVLPGFGQFYNGELNKAIWLFLMFALVSVPGIAFVALYLPNGWMVPALVFSLAATLGLWLYGMLDAWKIARRRTHHELAAWQLSGVYALVFILCNVLVLPLTIGFVREHEVVPFRIPSASMVPTVLPGDYIFADKRYNCPGCKEALSRGDIAIFAYPNNRTLYYIKRIIGLPGDRIAIRGDEVRVNDKPLKIDAGPTGTRVTEGDGDRRWQTLAARTNSQNLEVTVPAGQVFLLGDNRGESTDSRQFGTVPLQDVVGKARQVWFSRHAGRIRWDRLGQVLN